MINNKPSDRLLPHSPLPRQYPFLTRHSAKSFIVGYTLDKTLAPFDTTLIIPHSLGFAPIHDMWYAETPSVSGDYRKDYNPFIAPIWHTPARVMGSTFNIVTMQEYYLTTTPTSSIVHISHATTGTGTHHIYFHVKLYLDEFLTDSFDGTAWQVTAPVGK